MAVYHGRSTWSLGVGMDSISTSLDKTPFLVATVAELRRRLGSRAFAISDYWAADQTAVGLSHPARPGLLMYLAVSEVDPEAFFVSFESSPSGKWVDHPYLPEEERRVDGLDALADALAAHLSRADA